MGRRITHYEDLEWNEIVGFRIAARRGDLNRTQVWLAEKVEISVTTLCMIETGKSGLGSHILYRIARALHCDMGYFYAPIRTAETVTF